MSSIVYVAVSTELNIVVSGDDRGTSIIHSFRDGRIIRVLADRTV